MGKRKNLAATEQITIATTPQARKVLQLLAAQGLHGKNEAEVAEELLRTKLREFVDQPKFSGDQLAD
jgi:hypothetical protein